MGDEGDDTFSKAEVIKLLLYIRLFTEKGVYAGNINGPVFIPAHTIHSFILYHNRKLPKEPVENAGEICYNIIKVTACVHTWGHAVGIFEKRWTSLFPNVNRRRAFLRPFGMEWAGHFLLLFWRKKP
jgi:hypothetical protein